MSTGTALFPGINDIYDQLDRIFSIRGLPNLQQWLEVVNLPNWQVFQFSPYIQMEWNSVGIYFGNENKSGEDLLTKFLQVTTNFWKK